jgi:acylpyruvate hydrolase
VNNVKLVSYKHKGGLDTYRIGFIDRDNIVDLQETYQNMLLDTDRVDEAYTYQSLLPSNPDTFFSLGAIGLSRAKESYDYYVNQPSKVSPYKREQLILGPPVPNPSKIICIGTNYADHVAEMKSSIPEYPVLFAKFTNALIGPDDDIEKSPLTEKLDYEVELAVVIGKEAVSVSEQDALEYVAGYTIGNDVSARDLQKRTPQWLQGKSLDKSTPIGPWIVTKDELKDPANLELKSYINGEIRQHSNTKHLIFNIPHLISFISNLMTLNPGDIILTGTPHGVGFAMDPPQFLQNGDVVTLEIDGIGKLENKVCPKQ